MDISSEALQNIILRSYEDGYKLGYDVGRAEKSKAYNNKPPITKDDEPLFGDIYKEFCSNYPDFATEVIDWRPYTPPYTKELIVLNIIIWTKTDGTKRYCYITKKLYPVRKESVKNGS